MHLQKRCQSKSCRAPKYKYFYFYGFFSYEVLGVTCGVQKEVMFQSLKQIIFKNRLIHFQERLFGIILPITMLNKKNTRTIPFLNVGGKGGGLGWKSHDFIRAQIDCNKKKKTKNLFKLTLKSIKRQTFLFFMTFPSVTMEGSYKQTKK